MLTHSPKCVTSKFIQMSRRNPCQMRQKTKAEQYFTCKCRPHGLLFTGARPTGEDNDLPSKKEIVWTSQLSRSAVLQHRWRFLFLEQNRSNIGNKFVLNFAKLRKINWMILLNLKMLFDWIRLGGRFVTASWPIDNIWLNWNQFPHSADSSGRLFRGNSPR